MDFAELKEEIKRRLSIEDVVSPYVALQRAGSRLKARCPFHQEKTPSFFVNPALGLWKCFGCGAGGDIFDFVMKIEGLSFSEAGERLAERVGLQWRIQPGEEARAKRRQLIRLANQIAARVFRDLLFSEQGRPGLDYLLERGFTEETIRRFGLGYAAQGWDSLLHALRQQGIDESIAAEAGLVKERTYGGYYDVFRNRVMFPIFDVSNRVIGFGGRALDPEDPAKYLNTPDTPMFKKGQHVYGLNLARPAVVRERAVIVVEGYTDVLSLHQAGVENVVACLGTALTADHLRLLSRYAEEIILAYDADAAGMQAAARNIPLLEACPAEVRIVVLPAGLDPDECIKREGVEAFRALLDQRMAPVQYEIGLKFAQHRGQGADGLARAAREAVEVLMRVSDRARRDHYMAQAADLWGEGNPARTESMQRALHLELRRRLSERQAGPLRGRQDTPRDQSFIMEALGRRGEEVPRGLVRVERELLVAALSDRDLAEKVLQAQAPEEFLTPHHRTIAGAIASHLAEGGPYAPRTIVDRLAANEEIRELVVDLSLQEPPAQAEEVIAAGLAKLRAYRASGGHVGRYEIPTDEEDVLAPQPVGRWEELQQRVADKINRGICDPDDPDIALFRSYAALIHGKGGLDYFQARADFAAGQQTLKAFLPHLAAEEELRPDPAAESPTTVAPDEGS